MRDVVQYDYFTDDFVIGWRNYVWANQAWHAAKPTYAGHPQLEDFGEGFRAGYRDVAAGSDGCPPPLPPRQYWSWKYQSPEGKAKVVAWFAGYPHGAATAEQECAGNWRQIQVSHVIEEQYSPEFERAQIARTDGTPFPQPARRAMLDSRVGPAEILPEASRIPPGETPQLVPREQPGPAFNDGTTRGFHFRSQVAAVRGRIMLASDQTTGQAGQQRSGGPRLPGSFGFIARPHDGATPRVLGAQ